MTLALDSALRDVLAGDAERPYLEVRGEWVSLGQVRAISQAVLELLEKAGVASDAPLGLIARNRAPHVAALFGLLSQRRHVVMLHAYQARENLAAELTALAMGAVIADAGDWEDVLRGAAVNAGMLGIALGGERGIAAVTHVPGTAAAGRKFAPSDTAIEMLTSGTTGPPKRVPISYATLAAAVQDAIVATAQANTTDASAPFIQFYPLGNISGLFGLITCAVRGQPAVLLERFSVDEWVRAVKAYRPSAFMSLPPAAMRMVLDSDVPREVMSSIPAMRCGSAPLDPSVQREFEERYGIPVLINYGATEFCGVIANWTIADHRRYRDVKLGSVGRARPGIKLRVTDPDTGQVQAAGEIGRLEVLAPRVSADWVPTTDLARIDADGFVFLKGRTDSVIIRGGFKVSPEAIAEVLRRDPAVEDAGVVGLPDPRLGEVPVAAIQLREGAAPPDVQALIDAVRSAISPQAAPVRIAIVEHLPRNGSLKLDRAALRRILEAA
ncbi:hypothetical protein GCM10023232_14840 [Sphingosinicella ginsenosidimutans]|nr:long-chain fatty acid--CoA ligase [Sphingosinicella ginsenosidimutans]